MEKGLLMLTLSMLCLWLLLDEFFGTKKLTLVAGKMTPDFNLGKVWKDDKQAEESREEAHKEIEKSPNIKKDDAKENLDDMVDHFYGPRPS